MSRRCPISASARRVAAALGLLMALACTHACGDSAASTAQYEQHVPTADGTWVRLDGRVVTAGPNAFELDYGTGFITVEMDDWDWYHEGRAVLPNDDVTVYGRVDNDFYRLRSIEASSVYVKSLGTTFFASPADEEALGMGQGAPVDLGSIGLMGKVQSVDGREFVLDTGAGNVTVDTSLLGYNPLDDEGFQQIDRGDRVRVVGRVDDDLFDKRRVTAEQVIMMSSSSAKPESASTG